MKKIISALLAVMMLGQTAFAANLKDFVATTFPTAIVDGKFDWATFSGNVIETPVTTTVKVHNEGTYADHSTTALNSGDYTKTSFDYKATLDMLAVRNSFDTLYDLTIAALTSEPALTQQFKDSTVTGEFIVEVAYDTGLSLDPATTFELKQNGAAAPMFSLTSRDTVSNPARFTFNVISGVNVEDLRTNKNDWLADLTMEVANVTAVAGANRTLSVSMTSAYTILNDATDTPADYAKIAFTTPTPAPATASAIVYVPAAPSTGGGGSYVTPKAFTIVEGEKTPVDVTKENGKYYVDVDTIEKPVKEGYTFDGWYSDDAFTTPTSGKQEIKKNTYFYGRFVAEGVVIPEAYKVVDGETEKVAVTEEDGVYTVDVDELEVPEMDGYVFNGWYTDSVYTEPVSGVITLTEDTYLYAQFINVSAPSKLIYDDHIAYIMGYPDGEVKPNGLITREEVAAAFYRLLEPEYKATVEATTHQFPDVAATRWSNEEIATLANAGIIIGDEKGNFNPAKPITRAEFVTMATKFADITEVSETSKFTDIAGHWAEEFILAATNDLYWITGYEDNTFRPNNSITRAEAMTIINKMLVRYGDIDSEFAKQWPDVSADDWFYSNVIEATTAHEYERLPDGWNENWTAAK